MQKQVALPVTYPLVTGKAVPIRLPTAFFVKKFYNLRVNRSTSCLDLEWGRT